jgi:hypothetical protein
MIETRSMKNIRVIEIETERMMIYRIASIIEMIDKILKNEIEMIVSVSISFLMMRIDDCRGFLMNEIDHCKGFLIFQKFQEFLMREFLELLIEMKMKMIVSENFSLLMIREIIVSLMLDEMLFLLLIDFEVMILEI